MRLFLWDLSAADQPGSDGNAVNHTVTIHQVNFIVEIHRGAAVAGDQPQLIAQFLIACVAPQLQMLLIGSDFFGLSQG